MREDNCSFNVDENRVNFETVGEEDVSDLNAEFESFSQAVVWGTDWTTETINHQLVKGNIDLDPHFQRRDAWNDTEKSSFIESLMLGIPTPPIILAENHLKKNAFLVIDGKQRLLSIRRFYKEEQSIESENDFQQLRLKDLKILKELNTKNYGDVSSYNNEYIRNIDNQPIRTIVIKNWRDEDFLYTVFLRLNTGSKKLSPQELRQALHPGEFLRFLDEKTSKSSAFHRVLNSKNPDPRMKDIELALRFFSYQYYFNQYDGNLKNFLDTSCKRITENWNEAEMESRFKELEHAIDFSYDLMAPDRPFCRYRNQQSSNYFNRAIFEIFTYYFSSQRLRDITLECKDDFVFKFKALNDNAIFSSAVNDTTKNTRKLIERHNLFADLLKSLNGFENERIVKFQIGEGNKIFTCEV